MIVTNVFQFCFLWGEGVVDGVGVLGWLGGLQPCFISSQTQTIVLLRFQTPRTCPSIIIVSGRKDRQTEVHIEVVPT